MSSVSGLNSGSNDYQTLLQQIEGSLSTLSVSISASTIASSSILDQIILSIKDNSKNAASGVTGATDASTAEGSGTGTEKTPIQELLAKIYSSQ